LPRVQRVEVQSSLDASLKLDPYGLGMQQNYLVQCSSPLATNLTETEDITMTPNIETKTFIAGVDLAKDGIIVHLLQDPRAGAKDQPA
jgi:hypothetical protein